MIEKEIESSSVWVWQGFICSRELTARLIFVSPQDESKEAPAEPKDEL